MLCHAPVESGPFRLEKRGSPGDPDIIPSRTRSELFSFSSSFDPRVIAISLPVPHRNTPPLRSSCGTCAQPGIHDPLKAYRVQRANQSLGRTPLSHGHTSDPGASHIPQQSHTSTTGDLGHPHKSSNFNSSHRVSRLYPDLVPGHSSDL